MTRNNQEYKKHLDGCESFQVFVRLAINFRPVSVYCGVSTRMQEEVTWTHDAALHKSGPVLLLLEKEAVLLHLSFPVFM